MMVTLLTFFWYLWNSINEEKKREDISRRIVWAMDVS